MREASFLIAGMGTAAWLVVVGLTLLSGSDPAAADLDVMIATAVSIAYAITAAPALVLLFRRRAPRAAFALAIAFPGLLGLLFAIVMAGL